jgi:hypothetical protein
MRVFPLFLSLSLLLCGCYTEASLTRDERAPDDSKVFFYLHDGSYVKSLSHKHHRVESGYQAAGTKMTKARTSENFDGILQDADIASIGSMEFNLWGTVALVGGTTLFVAGLIAVGSSMQGFGGSF